MRVKSVQDAVTALMFVRSGSLRCGSGVIKVANIKLE